MASVDAVLSNQVSAEEIVSAPGPKPWARLWTFPSAKELLEDSERRILEGVQTPLAQDMVPIELYGQTYHINTIQTINQIECDSVLADYPLVLLHGFGGGLGMFVKNVDPLAKHYKVVALDCLGFGKSSRPHFPEDPKEAENMFVDALEAWRQAMRLEKMLLLGHSFGGYISTAYALKYPQHIAHLILADPWGFPLRPANPGARFSLWSRLIVGSFKRRTPLSILRAVGPFGPRLLARVRPDLGRKFQEMFADPSVVYQYIFAINAQQASAELGFLTLTHPFGFAKMPMIERAPHIDPSIPITFIYGQHSWMNDTMGERVQAHRVAAQCAPVRQFILQNSGHHVYCDQPDEFNRIVAVLAPLHTHVHDMDTDTPLSQPLDESAISAEPASPFCRLSSQPESVPLTV